MAAHWSISSWSVRFPGILRAVTGLHARNLQYEKSLKMDIFFTIRKPSMSPKPSDSLKARQIRSSELFDFLSAIVISDGRPLCMQVSLYLQHDKLKEQHEILCFPSKFPPSFLIHTINGHITVDNLHGICIKSRANQARYATFDGNGSRYRRVSATMHRIVTVNHIFNARHRIA